MSVVILQKSFQPESLPDLEEPPRWPGKSQGNKNPPKIPRPSDSIGKRNKIKTIGEMSDAVNARRDKLQLISRKEISELSRRNLHVHPPDVPFQEYKLKRSVRERPMSEICIPPEWNRRKWDVAPIEGPFNIPELSAKKGSKSSAYLNSDVNLTTDSLPPMSDTVKPKPLKQPVRPKSLPPPPDAFGSQIPIPQVRAPIRRQRARQMRRPRSAQLPSCNGDFDFLESLARTRTEMTQGKLEKYNMDIVSGAALSGPGWGDRTIDKRFLEEAAREMMAMENFKVKQSIIKVMSTGSDQKLHPQIDFQDKK